MDGHRHHHLIIIIIFFIILVIIALGLGRHTRHIDQPHWLYAAGPGSNEVEGQTKLVTPHRWWAG